MASKLILSYHGDSDADVAIATKALLSWQCCARCVLRFIGEKEQDTYRKSTQEIESIIKDICSHDNANKTLKQQNDTTKTDTESNMETETHSNDIQCANGDGDDTVKAVETVDNNEKIEDEDNEACISKDPCVSCLGILQGQYEENYLQKIYEVVKESGFEYSDYMASMTLPPATLLRQHSLLVLLREKLPKMYEGCVEDDVPPIKEVWKWGNGPSLAHLLQVPFKKDSPFLINMEFENEETNNECNFLLDLYPDVFRKRKHSNTVAKYGKDLFTRANVASAINDTTDKLFKKQYQCPPRKLSKVCSCKLSCSHDALFLAGRYNKYSRSLPQSPWMINGVRKGDSSVQELIANPLMKLVKADDYTLSASGREDVDVRMLGTGRPFLLEFVNPKIVNLTDEKLAEMTKLINESTTDIAIRDLQVITREETSCLKSGEEEKTKSYSALCWIKDATSQEKLDKLNELKDTVLKQKTPVRVLHRRSLATRDRTVHSMSADYIDEHHFTLHLETEAGTYIKEFVHSDFGRTTPSLGTILGSECDILTLDVQAVNLDWPKEIPTVKQGDEIPNLQHKDPDVPAIAEENDSQSIIKTTNEDT